MAIPRSLPVFGSGQSYNRAAFDYQPAYWSFCEAVRKSIDSNPTANTGLTVSAGDLLQSRLASVDGSAILQAYDGGTGYWVNNDLTTNGPLLNNAVSDINGYSTKPPLILNSSGEQDAGLITTEAQSTNVKTAMQNVLLPQLRSALNPGSPTDVPVWLDLLGPRFPDDELGEFWVRDRFIEIIESGTRIYRGAEKYALQLDQTMHPTSDAYRQMGAHLGRKVAQWLLDLSDMRGPQITSPVRSGNDVTVSITVPAGKTLIKPAAPDFFGLFDANDIPIAITGFSWPGDDLTITGATQPTKVRYPCPTGKPLVDITKIIRLSDPSDPIYPGEPGLVLESMKTHVF